MASNFVKRTHRLAALPLTVLNKVQPQVQLGGVDISVRLEIRLRVEMGAGVPSLDSAILQMVFDRLLTILRYVGIVSPKYFINSS